MTPEQLRQYVMEFFIDTSRSREDTRESLEDLRAELDGLIESLMDEDD